MTAKKELAILDAKINDWFSDNWGRDGVDGLFEWYCQTDENDFYELKRIYRNMGCQRNVAS